MSKIKNNKFTEDELNFLYQKVKKNRTLKEKERIDLSVFNNKVQSDCTDLDKSDVKNIKLKIIETLLNCDDFKFEVHVDDYDNEQEVFLITFDSEEESFESYINRLNYVGKEILRKEKSRLKRIAEKESRRVLFEKKIIKTPKKEIKEEPIEIYYQPFYPF